MAFKDPKARTAGALGSLQVQEHLCCFFAVSVRWDSNPIPRDKMFLVSPMKPCNPIHLGKFMHIEQKTQHNHEHIMSI